MRQLFSVFILTLFLYPTYAQSQVRSEPFIIQGQLSHLSPGQMILFFRDAKKGYKDYVIDTMQVDSTGRFYLKTYNVIEPTTATLRKEFLSVNLYAAPGYNLTLNGNVSDIALFQQQKQITGLGSAANAFLFKSDSLEWAVAAKDTVPWPTLPLPKLQDFVNKYKHNRDSLYQLIFNKPRNNDKWFSSFANMSQLDTRFMAIYYIISGAKNDTSLSYLQSVAFVNKNIDKTILNNLYDDKYLVSENYKGWFTGTYPYYLQALNNRRLPGYKNEKETDIQLIDLIAKNYKNKIREIRLYAKLEQTIKYCPSFEDLALYKEKLPVYIASLKDKNDKTRLDSLLSSMESTLRTTQIGKPAPLFTAVDSTGKSYNLKDYIGKVIYLDFWASWCGPCRAKMPYLQKLSEKFKDNNIVFISVGVLDDPIRWRKAVIADKPTWLQLFDNKANVQKSYFVNSIPKYILINKKGEIVSFDAPKPSSGVKIETIIKNELAN